MRFRRIEIPAYGPFTDFSAEFPGEGSDFHLVYGPNEAGKSSLLRAMRGFLFGIPAQTPDNFRHEYKKLCVLAELEGEDGQSRVFKRRKGNQNTLLDEDGSPVAEGELRAMLGAVVYVVLSQRLALQTTARPFDIYRALRVVNPSPFMSGAYRDCIAKAKDSSQGGCKYNQSGIMCGRPLRPIVATWTVRCSSANRHSSPAVMRIWSRRVAMVAYRNGRWRSTPSATRSRRSTPTRSSTRRRR